MRVGLSALELQVGTSGHGGLWQILRLRTLQLKKSMGGNTFLEDSECKCGGGPFSMQERIEGLKILTE